MTLVSTLPLPLPNCRLKERFFSFLSLYLSASRASLSFLSRQKLCPLLVAFCAFFLFPANIFACERETISPPVGFGVIKQGYLAETVSCKYCGRTATSAKQLAGMGVCPNSPSRKHVASRGRKARQFYVCRYCGFRASSIRTLTAGACRANPNGKKHVVTD